MSKETKLKKLMKRTYLGETKYWAILAAIFALGGIVLSYLHYPLGYSFKTNWMSDLGNLFWNPYGAVYFNMGLIVSGIILILFVFIRAQQKLVIVTGVIMSFALIGVGYFPENFPPQHLTFAPIFFASAFLCISILNVLNAYSTRWLLILGFLVFALNVVFIFNITPFMEWVVFGFDFLFLFVMAYHSYGFSKDMKASKLF